MMEAITTQQYPILFNRQCYSYLAELLQPESYSKIFIVVDTNTSQHCLPDFIAQIATHITIEIIEIDPGEANKTIETCMQVWHVLAELGCDRKSIIINLGGGVVTDLGGFVASTFKRGIDFINVPTTLLAMVDAAIGGKTGVDLGAIKNQIGVINNPAAVLVDVSFLQTLPQSEMRSGMAEMLKHGLIADKKYWNNFTDLGSLTTDDLEGLIYRSIQIKTEIVQQDPTEKGLRKVLNFGHTIGHAVESYFLDNNNTKITLLHGEAIAIGMILEAYFSLKKNLITEGEYIEIKSVISSIFKQVDFTPEDVTEVLKLLLHDKKNEFGSINFVLLESIGKAIINQSVDNDMIYNGFKDYMKQ